MDTKDIREFILRKLDLLERHTRTPRPEFEQEIQQIKQYCASVNEISTVTQETIAEQQKEIADLTKQVQDLRVEKEVSETRWNIKTLQMMIDQLDRDKALSDSLATKSDSLKKEISDTYEEIKIKNIEKARIQAEDLERFSSPNSISPEIAEIRKEDIKKKLKHPTVGRIPVSLRRTPKPS